MPADTLRRGDTLREPIQVPVSVAEPLVPQSLPREQLRILDQQAPERHERAVGGARPRAPPPGAGPPAAGAPPAPAARSAVRRAAGAPPGGGGAAGAAAARA